jgi:hypothetical protein
MIRLFVITHGTKDYGDKYVVRENLDGVGTPLAIVCSSLEEARGAVEEHNPSLVRLEPCEFDDPVIVESWGSAADVEACRVTQEALRTGAFV